jgi:hypothetical protein
MGRQRISILGTCIPKNVTLVFQLASEFMNMYVRRLERGSHTARNIDRTKGELNTASRIWGIILKLQVVCLFL